MSQENLAAAAEQSPPTSIIVIGANIRLRNELDWLARTAVTLDPS